MGKPAAGIQMYSLRDETERDFLGTLEKVAAIGYEAAEIVDYYNVPARQLRGKAQGLGLELPSTVVSLNFKELEKLEKDLAKDAEYAAEMGARYVVTPWIPIPEAPRKEDVTYLADLLHRCSDVVKKAGMEYVLHHHELELKSVQGKPILDWLIELLPADKLQIELDLGWIYMAGYDPADYLRRYKGRVPLVHLKDFQKGRKDAELGSGVVGYERLLKELEPAGVRYMFVEQEQVPKSSLDSAKENYAFLQKVGLVPEQKSKPGAGGQEGGSGGEERDRGGDGIGGDDSARNDSGQFADENEGEAGDESGQYPDKGGSGGEDGQFAKGTEGGADDESGRPPEVPEGGHGNEGGQCPNKTEGETDDESGQPPAENGSGDRAEASPRKKKRRKWRNKSVIKVLFGESEENSGEERA